MDAKLGDRGDSMSRDGGGGGGGGMPDAALEEAAAARCHVDGVIKYGYVDKCKARHVPTLSTYRGIQRLARPMVNHAMCHRCVTARAASGSASGSRYAMTGCCCAIDRQRTTSPPRWSLLLLCPSCARRYSLHHNKSRHNNR